MSLCEKSAKIRVYPRHPRSAKSLIYFFIPKFGCNLHYSNDTKPTTNRLIEKSTPFTY